MGYHKGAHRVRREDMGHRSPRQQLIPTSSEKPEMADQGIHPASPESRLWQNRDHFLACRHYGFQGYNLFFNCLNPTRVLTLRQLHFGDKLITHSPPGRVWQVDEISYSH